MKIIIATKNPGKIEGAKEAFVEYFKEFEIEGISANSDVPEEPVNEQIYEGASNRVKNVRKIAQEQGKEADYYIAVESGITNKLGEWAIINIAVIEDKKGFKSFGTSQGFPVPNKYVKEIIETDLGKVMDRIFNETELRAGKGGINLLTKDKVSRIDLTKQAFIMALTQFLNGEIWR